MTDTLGAADGPGQQPPNSSATRPPSPPTARVVEIVEILGTADGPLSLADIVRRTGHSRATAHAILGELTARGWAMRLPDGNYSTGGRLVGLAVAISRADHLTRRAGPLLDALAEQLGLHCFLARRVGDEITIAVGSAPPGHGPGSAAWLTSDARMPLRPPVCREFLAWAPPAERASWIATAPASLRTRLTLVLDAVRERGASIERMTDDHVALMATLDSLKVPAGVRVRVDELLEQISTIDYLPDELGDDTIAAVTIGAPVFDAGGGVHASVVVCPGGRVDRTELDHLVDAARGCAAELSEGGCGDLTVTP
ncbi:IclR family transcriptional regulator [Gordonia polyisoprenivorans]|uniref:IclR family transcriptional regulator n=1 Tax=Gordonia polyisoprenivorans TaxID=84595 RepID=UPI001F0AFF01|nr:helix-turn-helix domain-containing protein [Gordonia polyisoprenivorans]